MSLRFFLTVVVALLPLAEAVAQSNASILDRYALGSEVVTEWRLPGRLREISGLAMTPDDRLFAHDDEEAVIYEVDYEEGELVKAFAFGDTTAKADFEGIAYVDGLVYLVTSAGRIYEGPEGDDGERVLFNTYGTGVGRYCEVEGLAFEPADRTLLLLCKDARADALEDYIAIYRWSLDRRAMADDSLLLFSAAALSNPVGEDDLRPSGIDRHPETGNYVIVAAREAVLAEVTPAGGVVGVRELRKKTHGQAEGISFASDGTLLISDEGGSKRARLVLYSVR